MKITIEFYEASKLRPAESCKVLTANQDKDDGSLSCFLDVYYSRKHDAFNCQDDDDSTPVNNFTDTEYDKQLWAYIPEANDGD